MARGTEYIRGAYPGFPVKHEKRIRVPDPVNYSFGLKLKNKIFNRKVNGVKSGIIDYLYAGDRAGKETLYFNDFRMKRVMCTDTVENLLIRQFL